MSLTEILLWIMVLLIVGLVVWIKLEPRRTAAKVEEIRQRERREFVRRSSRTRVGKTVQHFVPFLEDFPYDPSDARFLGNPIDFIIFEGMTDGRVHRVVLLEVKTGEGRLKPVQNKIRSAVEIGEVDFEIFSLAEPLYPLDLQPATDPKMIAELNSFRDSD